MRDVSLCLMASVAFLCACGGSSHGDLFGGGSPAEGTGGATATPVMTGGAVGAGGGVAAGGGIAAGGSVGAGGAAPLSDGGGSGGAVIGTGGIPVDAAPEAPVIQCPAGIYTGTWNGQYHSTISLGTSQATSGTLDLTVDASGLVTGTFTATSPLSSVSDVQGVLDCTTDLLSAQLSNGSYSSLFPPVSAKFSGTLTGKFDRGAAAFIEGKWVLVETNPANGGEGTWFAN